MTRSEVFYRFQPLFEVSSERLGCKRDAIEVDNLSMTKSEVFQRFQPGGASEQITVEVQRLTRSEVF